MNKTSIMKIGFDAKRAFLNSSGLGNYSRTTINALNQYYPKNSYVLFTPQIKSDLFQNYRDFDVISPESSFSKIFKSLWRSFSVGSYLEKKELDVFHGLSNELPDGVHKSEVPAVVTIHDLIFMRFPEFYKPIDRNIYYRKVKYACTAANKIIAISQQTKHDLIEYFAVPKEKIKVVHQSISPIFFSDLIKSNVKEKYDLPEKYMVSVGTLEPRKNQITVLKTLHQIDSEFSVVFVGNPTNYSAELIHYISENKLENRVRFISNVPESDLVEIYRQAELSLYISIFEGFGLPVIESMACGCPVITSNVSCLPETAGNAAVLCNPEDPEEIGIQIKKIINKKAFRNELVLKGKQRAQHFHPKIYAEKIISLYAEIII